MHVKIVLKILNIIVKKFCNFSNEAVGKEINMKYLLPGKYMTLVDFFRALCRKYFLNINFIFLLIWGLWDAGR